MRATLKDSWRSIVIVIVLSFIGHAFIQWAIAGLADSDSYYHTKMGWLIRQHGLTPAFPWLPLTILNPVEYYDHHLLYHVYLALFTSSDPTINGGLALIAQAKWATVMLNTFTWLAMWWLLARQNVRWAVLWTVGLFGLSYIFLFRLHMVRAQTASLMVLAIALHCLFQQRYRWLLPIGIIYVWLYDAFPMLLGLVVIHSIAVRIIERRWIWSALAYTSVGIALGLVINPYFPHNVLFTLKHILPKLQSATTQLGPEWYPYDLKTLIFTSGFAFLAIILATILIWQQRRKLSTAMLSSWIWAALLAILAIRSKRFLEYSPAFGLIALAINAQPHIEQWLTRPTSDRRFKLIASAGLVLSVFIVLINARQAMQAIAIYHPVATNRDVAVWTREHVPANQIIFNTSWHHFPFLFFHDSTHNYTLGLDPTYMQLHNPTRYATWEQIVKGELATPAQTIKQEFGANYVVAQIEQAAFLQQAQHDPNMREVFRDQFAVVFALEP